jgi:hypothetical protein
MSFASSSAVRRSVSADGGRPHIQQTSECSGDQSTLQSAQLSSASASSPTPVIINVPFKVSVYSLVEPIHLFVDPFHRPGDPCQFLHVRVVLTRVRTFEPS